MKSKVLTVALSAGIGLLILGLLLGASYLLTLMGGVIV